MLLQFLCRLHLFCGRRRSCAKLDFSFEFFRDSLTSRVIKALYLRHALTGLFADRATHALQTTSDLHTKPALFSATTFCSIYRTVPVNSPNPG